MRDDLARYTRYNSAIGAARHWHAIAALAIRVANRVVKRAAHVATAKHRAQPLYSTENDHWTNSLSLSVTCTTRS